MAQRDYFAILANYAAVLALFFIVLNFFIFHVGLVLNNNTTLERLDAQRGQAQATREVG